MRQFQEEETAISRIENWQERWGKYFERYSIEIVVTVIIALSGINWCVGRVLNQRRANDWLSTVKNLLETQFKVTELDFEDNTSNEFQVMLAGRQSMIYCNLNLVLEKRQDIGTILASGFFSSCFSFQRDTLWVDIPIKRDDAIKSEILLVQAKDLPAAKKAMPHIDALLKPMSPNFFENTTTLSLMGETQESVDSIFGSPAVQSFMKSQSLTKVIKTIHVTDQKLYNNFDLMLKVQISADAASVGNHVQVLEFLFALADHLASKKYSVPRQIQEQLAKSRQTKLNRLNLKLKKEEEAKKKK